MREGGGRGMRTLKHNTVFYTWRKHVAQLEMNFDSDIFRSNILEFIRNGNELSSSYAFNCNLINVFQLFSLQ